MKKLKFVVGRHRDGYVAYPLGLKGAVVGESDSSESALADAKSAAAFHIESFGERSLRSFLTMMKSYHVDPAILGGEPVFIGTRVPIQSLFAHLEAG